MPANDWASERRARQMSAASSAAATIDGCHSPLATSPPCFRLAAFRGYVIPLILSALVIGSMAPDAAHFVPFDVWWASGHTWTGLVVMDVPITLALVALYWLLLASPLRALARSRSAHGCRRTSSPVTASCGRAPSGCW